MLEEDLMPVDEAPADEGDGAPRQSYNFAPGYHGVVYRADVPDRGAGYSHSNRAGQDAEVQGEQQEEEDADNHADSDKPKQKETAATRYKLQAMKWGLIPFWTKRSPEYGGVLKTINCRDDSLAQPGGMWASMKARKRCVVVAEGFYEWLKQGKEKIPHYVKRKDGKLMCFAGLWDCVQYEADGDKHYTYTIITTDSNKQLKFLHDRMPVILEAGSEAMRTWLDPGRCEWSKELQALLRPFEGELEVYPVSKEVGKVGNNSPSFVIPVASRENKSNIANFFARGAAAKKKEGGTVKPEVEVEVQKEGADGSETKTETETETETVEELARTADDGGMMSMTPSKKASKREASSPPAKGEQPPAKKKADLSSASSPVQEKRQTRSSKISATSNAPRSPVKAKAAAKAAGSQKITKFFGNSA
jgi:putative SOS response-associated peptidase YedK